MEFSFINEIEKKTKEDSKLKHFDPQKIFMYYMFLTQSRLQEVEEKHPADDILFEEVNQKDKELGLEEVLEDEESRNRFEHKLKRKINLKGYYHAFDPEQQKGILAVYYELPDEQKKKNVADYFLLSPGSIKLIRATQGELGEGVLGVAYPGLGLIKVLDSLYGTDFDEVYRHEVNHILLPSMPERDIRNLTASQCSYQCKYN